MEAESPDQLLERVLKLLTELQIDHTLKREAILKEIRARLAKL